MKNKPNIPARLLWEYDYDTFNFDKSYKIVIERVMQLGDLDEWREVVNYFQESKSYQLLNGLRSWMKEIKSFAVSF